MRILQIHNPDELKKLMREIQVDPYGIKIMAPKGVSRLLRINALSNIAANILKQEMLSLGGEAAVSRNALTGKTKSTDCLLMGTLAQMSALSQKLTRQPFGLAKLSLQLNQTLENYNKENFILKLGSYKLNLGRQIAIMGIVNVTPDSFSGDGLLQVTGQFPSALRLGGAKETVPIVVDFAQKLASDGADIIDVGGESSRPGAKPVPFKEELRRTIPVIKALAKKINKPVSIDTCKPEVARQALENGASLVNDTSGLKDSRMAGIVKRYNAAVVIMHMRGCPRTMQKNPLYHSLIDDIISYLEKAVELAQRNGIAEEKIIIDPGLGFGKTLDHNLEILKHLKEFKVMGKPILVGPSRKSFLGKLLNEPAQKRTNGTVSACLAAAGNGAKILRVHDVYAVRQALKVFEEIDRA